MRPHYPTSTKASTPGAGRREASRGGASDGALRDGALRDGAAPRMPTRDRCDSFVGRVVDGRFVEALRDFDHDAAATRENGGAERRGLPALVAAEQPTLAAFGMRAHPPSAILLDRDDVAIHWTFDVTDPRGTVRRMAEVAPRRRRDGRAAFERSFSDPSLPAIEGDTPP